MHAHVHGILTIHTHRRGCRRLSSHSLSFNHSTAAWSREEDTSAGTGGAEGDPQEGTLHCMARLCHPLVIEGMEGDT